MTNESATPCEHSDTIAFDEPDDPVCKSCVGEGSPGKHAKKHHQQTGHPIIKSVESDWRWCY